MALAFATRDAGALAAIFPRYAVEAVFGATAFAGFRTAAAGVDAAFGFAAGALATAFALGAGGAAEEHKAATKKMTASFIGKTVLSLFYTCVTNALELPWIEETASL